MQRREERRGQDYVTEEYLQELQVEMMRRAKELDFEGAAEIRDLMSKLKGQPVAVPQLMNVLNTASTETAPGGENSSENTSGPFLGVASRSQRNSVITYYGIDRHDQWIFTPIFR